MEYHQLRYFVAAAEELSVSKAAERLHVSQPALSRQIRLLEEELGLELFLRLKQRIHLTDAGKFFLEKARQILCDSEMAVQRVRENFGGVRKTLRLGFLSPFLDDLIAPVVREFQQRHPRSQVSLFDLTPRAQLDRLRLRELDIGILANLSQTERASYDVTSLSKHRYLIVVPESHRLANRKSIKLAELAREDWVSLSNAFFPMRREFLTNACAKADFVPRIVSEAVSLPLMLAEIGMGVGVGIMPIHATKLPHSGCRMLTLISPVIESELLILTPYPPKDPEMLGLIELIKERASIL